MEQKFIKIEAQSLQRAVDYLTEQPFKQVHDILLDIQRSAQVIEDTPEQPGETALNSDQEKV